LAKVLKTESDAAQEQEQRSYLNRQYHAGELNSNPKAYCDLLVDLKWLWHQVPVGPRILRILELKYIEA
jgi:hypothetical protein